MMEDERKGREEKMMDWLEKMKIIWCELREFEFLEFLELILFI